MPAPGWGRRAGPDTDPALRNLKRQWHDVRARLQTQRAAAAAAGGRGGGPHAESWERTKWKRILHSLDERRSRRREGEPRSRERPQQLDAPVRFSSSASLVAYSVAAPAGAGREPR